MTYRLVLLNSDGESLLDIEIGKATDDETLVSPPGVSEDDAVWIVDESWGPVEEEIRFDMKKYGE